MNKLLSRRRVLGVFAVAFAGPMSKSLAAGPVVRVHKDPNCGCCTGWVKHLENAGFTLSVDETTELEPIRERLRVPPSLASCHVAEVSGYAIEGHVPAEAILRLLAQRPVASGLAVPGMPAGSPGMEGGTPESYDVIIFAESLQRPFMRFTGERRID